MPRPTFTAGPLEPSFHQFERLYDGVRAVPVWAEVRPAPHPAAPIVASDPASGLACLLQSAGPVRAETARWTVAVADPYMTVRGRSGTVTVERGDRVEVSGNPVETLRELLGERPARTAPGRPPFAGGAVGFFGYDFGRHFERLPNTAIDELDFEDLCLGFYEQVLLIDRLTGTAYVAATVEPAGSARATYNRAREVVAESIGRLSAADAPHGDYVCGQLEPLVERTDYENRIEAVRDYIRAGDVFQVNLSQRLSAEFGGDGLAVHQRLLSESPAAFSAYLRLPGGELIGASPERFLRVRERTIETMPIKGTTHRGATAAEDAGLERWLLNNGKELAEHIMTVDLLRNDLGRVAEYGSVEVSKLLEAERCPQVIHLVSTIEAKLRGEVGPVDILAATFPGGSVTGAPKIRAMEIIEELEGTRRGPYTGALGYIGFDGQLDLNIAIRTLVRTDERIHLQVGGGIVADSDPAREYEETMLKAKGLLAALAPERRTTIAA